MIIRLNHSPNCKRECLSLNAKQGSASQGLIIIRTSPSQGHSLRVPQDPPSSNSPIHQAFGAFHVPVPSSSVKVP